MKQGPNEINRMFQGWANFFNRRVIGRKPQTPVSCKISLHCQYK